MKVKHAKRFEFVDVNRETIASYFEKHKNNGKIDEAQQLEKVLCALDALNEITDDDIERIVNAEFDANIKKMKDLRKQIRKLPKGDDSRKEIRTQIRTISKYNLALLPFSKKQRIRVAALSAALH